MFSRIKVSYIRYDYGLVMCLYCPWCPPHYRDYTVNYPKRPHDAAVYHIEQSHTRKW